MNQTEAQFRYTQAEAHPSCLVCSRSNPNGLALKFCPDKNGGVSARFVGHAGLEGYPGLVHGGIVASLLDGAMTNCLFARGVVALTGELRIRYVKPVMIGLEIEIRAWLEEQHPPLFHLCAELTQEGELKARGWGRFMRKSEPALSNP